LSVGGSRPAASKERPSAGRPPIDRKPIDRKPIDRRSGDRPRKTKSGSPRWAKVLLGFGVALTLLSGIALIGGKILITRYTNQVDQQDMLGNAAADHKSDPLEGPLNLLLVGVDERTVEDDPEGTRSDTIMVLHVDASHQNVYLLSIPRDTLVDIPPFGKRTKPIQEKINAAFQLGSDNGGGRSGGFELLADTVNQLLGLKFDAGAIINFAGFKNVVDAMGGVDMCIDQRVQSIHLDVNGAPLGPHGTPATYRPGCQHLKPWQALDFVRQRHTAGGDYDRQRHQQQFLKAIGKEALSAGVVSNPGKLDRVLKAAGKTLTVDAGNAGLTDWAQLLAGIGMDHVTMIKTNGGKFASAKCPDGSSCQALTPDSYALFAAAKDDTVAAFLTDHPDWVATDN
jgi:LCP family protein required for cell wall assembly